MTNPRFAILYKVNEYEREDVMGNTRVPECDLRAERPVCRLYLPFASGNDIKLGTRPGGMAAFPAFVGFGVSDISINYFGEQINLDDEFANFAITLPETFAIDALAATFITYKPASTATASLPSKRNYITPTIARISLNQSKKLCLL